MLTRAKQLAAREGGLAVVVTLRPDGTPHASVVNAGFVRHPVNGDPCVGFVAQGREQTKLGHLRARPKVTVVFRSGRDWVAVDGDAELATPDEPLVGMTEDATFRLFHTIYCDAIGGSPLDWSSRDHVIEEEGHVAVLVTPARTYSSPPSI